MLIGYARVSTDDQHLDLQRDALQKAGCERVFEDTASGAKAERVGLATLMAVLRAGDTVVIWRLDRLGRSLKDLIALVEQLDAASAVLALRKNRLPSLPKLPELPKPRYPGRPRLSATGGHQALIQKAAENGQIAAG